jgi:hypothetical protein
MRQFLEDLTSSFEKSGFAFLLTDVFGTVVRGVTAFHLTTETSGSGKL